MKKFVIMFALAAVAMVFATGCGEKTKCATCDKEAYCKKVEVFGEKIPMCSDCRDKAEEASRR